MGNLNRLRKKNERKLCEMFRTKDLGGMALAIATLLLICYGSFCANKLCIFYWYYRPRLEEQAIQGLPLDGWGTFHFFAFNTLSMMAILTH